MSATSHADRARKRPAFTMIELTLSLSLMALVALAAVSLSAASATIWRESALTAERTRGALDRGNGYLRRMLSEAVGVGAVVPGSTPPAMLFIWSHDTLADSSVGVARDHAAQYGEMCLVRHEPDSGVMALYLPRPWSRMSASQRSQASMLLAPADMLDPDIAAAFATLDWVDRHVVLGGGGVSIAEATFSRSEHNAGTHVGYTILTVTGTKSRTIVGEVVVRAAGASDDWSTMQLLRSDAVTTAPNITNSSSE